MTVERLEIARPDDWHLHLRDGAMLEAIVGFSAAVFGRAIVMPNLVPPVRTPAEAEAYLARIRAALPEGHPFEPLMTAYMTDDADPSDIRAGFESGIFRAVKLYPAGATTNSAFGVTRMEAIRPVLAGMERIGMPLLVHGEVVDPEVDVFDREAVYIERVLDPMRRDFPGLKVVLEHVTTAEAVEYVSAADRLLGATITPHHLTINRNALFRGGIRPHMYCLPWPSASAIGSRCGKRRPRAIRDSFWAPIPRPTRAGTRKPIAAAPESSMLRTRCNASRRSSMRKARSTGWKDSSPARAPNSMGWSRIPTASFSKKR